MVDYYKYAEQYIQRKLRKAGLIKKQASTAKYNFDFWDTETKKPCIFLLNGFGADTTFQWFKQVQLLQEHYRVVLVNLLYFGNSKPAQGNCHDLECQVNFVETLRQELKLAKITIAGISYGGLVAAEYAHTFEENIKHLILIDAAVKFLTIDELEKVCKKYSANSIEDFFAPEDFIGLQKQLKAAYYKAPPLPRFILKPLHKKLCAPYRENWLGLIKSLRASINDLANRNYNFKVRTTIFWGAEDEIIPLEVGKSIAQELNNVQLNIIPKAGHMPNLERPALFNKLLRSTIKTEQ